MSTPSKGVDAELNSLLNAYGSRAYLGEPSGISKEETKTAIKALIRQELEAVRAEMSEKSRRAFKDPRRMADTQNAHKAAIDQANKVIDTHLEAL